MPPTTLKDVAAAVGISPGAVSLILRNGGRFSAATRKRVLATATRLNYRPNPLLASHKTGKRKATSACAALPIAYLGNHHLPDVAVLAPHAAALGYQIQLANFDEHPSPRRLGDILFHRGIRGIILGQLYGVTALPDLGWHRFATVCAGRPFFSVPFDIVRHHIFEVMLASFQRCLERGYRRIGFDVLVHKSFGPPHPDDRIRHAAALYCQSLQPPSDHSPLYLGEPTEHAPFLDWARTHTPEVIISNSGAHRFDLKTSAPDLFTQTSYLTLELNSAFHLSGWIQPNSERILKAIEILDHHIRYNCIGPQTHPTDHLIGYTWNEGTTLPPRPHAEQTQQQLK